ncbi:hypothetical protein KGF54_004217 [Candida jiufengensis]|uniref:uncharacterized protein n=1 Tax=Candida jiufengensis TaxID=497108 RepID=UPI0022258C56|nr:uncharacterized protein KGF54_004217 [Candida jiufengensis]KAI5951143.1 hypothetical protein KGF54_004217 [Candida jiufengensis]
MSYDGNKSHYTPRYNSSNSSRKLHEQSKNDSKSTSSSTTQPQYQTTSASNTAPSTGGRRDVYIGSGYKSRYNDSYTSKTSNPIKSNSGSSYYSSNINPTNGGNGIRSTSNSYYTSSLSGNTPISANSIRRRNDKYSPTTTTSSSTKYPDPTKNDKFISRTGLATSSTSYGNYRKDYSFKRQASPDSSSSYIKERSPATDPLSSFKDERRMSNPLEKPTTTTSSYISKSRKSSWETTTKNPSSLASSRKSSLDKPIKEKFESKRSSLSSISSLKQSESKRNSSVDSIGSNYGGELSNFDKELARKASIGDKSVKKEEPKKSFLIPRGKSDSTTPKIESEDNKFIPNKLSIKPESDIEKDSSNLQKKSTIPKSTQLVQKDSKSENKPSKDLQPIKKTIIDQTSTDSTDSNISSTKSSNASRSPSGIKKTSFNDYLKLSKEKKKIDEEKTTKNPDLIEENSSVITKAEKADDDKAIQNDETKDVEMKDETKSEFKETKNEDKSSVESTVNTTQDEESKPEHVSDEHIVEEKDEDAMEIDSKKEMTEPKLNMNKKDIDKEAELGSNKKADSSDNMEQVHIDEVKEESAIMEKDQKTIEDTPNEIALEKRPVLVEQDKEENDEVNTKQNKQQDTKSEDDIDMDELKDATPPDAPLKTNLNMTPHTTLKIEDSFNDSSILSPINDSKIKRNFSLKDIGLSSDKDKSLINDEIEEEDKNNDEEVNFSETETLIGTPPRLNHGRNLIKKSPVDDNRHKLKKKRAVVESSDEEMDTTNNNDQEENLVFASKTEYKPKPEKKLIPGKSMKKAPYKIKRDSSGRSLLQRACKKGSFEDVKEFLSRGANANEKDFCGFTCLHEAALEGHSEIVQYLIDHGANVNAKADEAGDSETPLIDAAENKHLETVKVLLKNDADPTIFNIDGFTALTKIYNEHADEDGYDEIIKALEAANNKITNRQISKAQSKGASPDSRFVVIDDPNENYFADLIKRKGIFKWAAENHKEVVANFFVSGNSLEDKPDILIIAARNGHSELIDIILGLNPTQYNIDTESPCGVTALLASVGRGQLEVVRSLLQKGADPFKMRKKDGLNALQIAEHSSRFNSKEVELIQESMEKKSGTKIISAVPSRVASRVTSKPSSRAPSVPVSDESEEEEMVQNNSSMRNEDEMNIDKEEERTKDEDTKSTKANEDIPKNKDVDATIENLEVKKVRGNQNKPDIKKIKSNEDKRITNDSKLEMKKVKSNDDGKKRKQDDLNDDDQHILKKSKSSSSISKLKFNSSTKENEDKMDIDASARIDKPIPAIKQSVVKFDTSESPTTSPSISTPTSTVPAVFEKAKSPPPLTPAQEEQKFKSAEEARIRQEKAEAKKKARKEMFLKIEKEKEMKKREEEEKKAEAKKKEEEKKAEEEKKEVEEEPKIAEAEPKQADEKIIEVNVESTASLQADEVNEEVEEKDEVKDIPKNPTTNNSTKNQEDKENKSRTYQFYPTGLRKIKFNSKPTVSTISKYSPLYVFIIDDEKYVLDLQISLLTLSPISNFESSINSSNSIVVENDIKLKIWKLFYKFIGINNNDKNLFLNLFIKFIKYEDALQLFKDKYPFVYTHLQQSQSIELLLDNLTGFDDLRKNSISLTDDSKTSKFDDIDIIKFIPPHLSYRKDIVRTIKSTNNPLWTSRLTLCNSDSDIETDENDQYVPPSLDFEFIEVDHKDTPQEDLAKVEEEEEEFAFPLFSSLAPSKPNTSKESEERGRSTSQPFTIQKISLREHSEERINNERPTSYYFASYSPLQKSQFEQIATTSDDIYSQSNFITSTKGKVINLNEHNRKIEEILAKAKSKSKKRPGKKKRESKIYCRERRLERAKIAKQEEKEKRAKAKQEKYGKFNKFKSGGGGSGRVNKKSFKNDKLTKNDKQFKNNKSNGGTANKNNQSSQKPKYRTE